MFINSISTVKNLVGRRVLVRADFNVPIKNGKVKDDYKIKKSLPTIEFLIKKGAKVILVSHLGRPKTIDKRLGLKPVARHLEGLLRKRVKILDIKDIKILKRYWEFASKRVSKMKAGEIIILDNIRFFSEEEKDGGTLAADLASLADIFVLDGFAVAHRAAASVSGVARYLPSYAGLLLAEEIEGLSRLLEKPKRPFVVVIGGAKLETKIPVLKKLLSLADHVLVGGGIATTCYFAKGKEVGCSLVDKQFLSEAKYYLKNKKVILPIDMVIGKNDGSDAKVMSLDGCCKIVNKKYGMYDIGPATVKLFSSYIKQAQTLVWNGAMGYFEQHPYEYGTYAIARLFASRSKGKSFGVCGGGETVEVLEKLKLMDDIDLVSTGGGAMLEFLSGKKLPGVEAVSAKSYKVRKVKKFVK